MRGMKMIEHLGSVALDASGGLAGIAAAGAGLAASAKMWTPSRLTFT
jgi:hypothetical protein